MRLSARMGFLVALAVGVAVRIALLAHPLAATDVTYYNPQAVSHLLRGVDPYGAVYSVPAHLATHGAEDVFAYLPGVFAFLVPGGSAALVACDVAVGAGLWLLPSKKGALWGSVFLLFPPFVLFSTSFPNDILPAIAFMAVGVALDARERPFPASLMWGLAFASSQAAWFVFPFYAARSLRSRRHAPLVVSLVTAVAVVAPFLAWDPGAFVHDVLLFQFGRAAAPLLSSGPFGVNVNPSLMGVLASMGTSAPLVLRGGGAALVLIALLWNPGKGVPSLAIRGAAFSAAALWLLSANFFWSYLELPAVLFFVWAALGGEGHRGASRLKEPGPG